MKERMLRGDLYLADDPELHADAERCDRLLAAFNATRAPDGAGAVVTKDLPEGVVAAGNPARVIRRVSDQAGG